MRSARNLVIIEEACSGAVCASCLQTKPDLKRCSSCHRAWYCSKDCQASHYKQHKAACKIAAPLIAELTDTITAQPVPTSHQQAQAPITAAGMLALDGCPQHNLEVFKMLHATVFCRACFRIREQLPPAERRRFRCCPCCLWGWCCCEEHWQQHKQQHQQHCNTYARMSGARLLGRKHILRFAGAETGPISYCPAGKVQQEQLQGLLAGWQQYVQRRRVPSCDPTAWQCSTECLSIPLTAVLACTRLYSSSELSSMRQFTLHLVGSAQYEFHHVMATTAVEEVMHLLPGVKRLHVVMVGPELLRIIGRASDPVSCEPLDKGTCPPCGAEGCSRHYSWYRGSYEAYAASSAWVPPTLALACNSGIGCADQDSWAPALALLLDRNIPACFTSLQQSEATYDCEALTAAGAALVAGPAANPFASLVPYRDSSGAADAFYHMNGYYTCIKGRTAAGAAAAGAGVAKA